MTTIKEITAKCEALKHTYEQAITEKENTWAKYERMRDWCKEVAIKFYAATDELDRAKEEGK